MKLFLLILFFMHVNFGRSRSVQYFGASRGDKLKLPQLLDVLMGKEEEKTETLSPIEQKLFEEELERTVKFKNKRRVF